MRSLAQTCMYGPRCAVTQHSPHACFAKDRVARPLANLPCACTVCAHHTRLSTRVLEALQECGMCVCEREIERGRAKSVCKRECKEGVRCVVYLSFLRLFCLYIVASLLLH